jgi:hypothetical protein
MDEKDVSYYINIYENNKKIMEAKWGTTKHILRTNIKQNLTELY